MNKLKAVSQKLKGKAQKAVGEYHLQQGHIVKGGIAKAKGELNERIADAKIKNEDQKAIREELEDDDVIL